MTIDDADRAAFLAQQPVAVLPVSPDMHRRLVQLGLRTLADVARIPEPALVSQFGREGRDAWQLAHDRIVEPVVGRERPQPIVVGVDFPLPAADGLLLAHGMKIQQGPQTLQMRVSKVEHNVEVPADKFELPEDVEKLVEKRDGAAEKSGAGEAEKTPEASGAGG